MREQRIGQNRHSAKGAGFSIVAFKKGRTGYCLFFLLVFAAFATPPV